MTVTDVRRAWRILNLAGLSAVVSCNPSTERPSFRPMLQSLVDTMPGFPETIIARVANAVQAAGVEVHKISVVDGYLETRPYDVELQQTRNPDAAHPEQNIVMRFWANPARGPGPAGGQGPRDHTQVVAEVVYRRTLDPSVPRRTTETIADSTHAGRAMLLEVLQAVRNQNTRD